MAKQARILCNRCEARLGDGPYCPSCGYPTPWATHDERVEWELRQWSSHQEPVGVASGANATHAAKTRERRWFRGRASAVNGAVHAPSVEPAPARKLPAPSAAAAEVIVSAAELRETQLAPAADARATYPFNAGAVPSTRLTTRAQTAPPPKLDRTSPPRKIAETERVVKRESVAPASPSKVAPLRSARRLPSIADIEEIAHEGPAMVRILRLINARIALIEAQVADEDTAAIG